MLSSTPITTNIVTTNIQSAKKFYVDTLGLKLNGDYGEALDIDAGGSPLFIYQREAPPKADHTVASWNTKDIHATVQELKSKGIQFEVYDGFDQDEDGISAQGENGPKAAWFKDPDGNILGVIEPGQM